MCVQNKEIHPWVSEICAGNKMRADGLQAGRTSEKPIPPLQLRQAGDNEDFDQIIVSLSLTYL